MNNPLKLFFIIFNLIPSIAPNNYSVPLSETELKMGQNVSEIVKRDEPISVYGGMKVLGFTPSGRELCQRSCTLSFPVLYNNDKGYLTSLICAESSVFVTEPHSVQVGHVQAAYSYKPELGLDYAFVSINSQHFSDTISRKISYSHCAKSGRGIVDIDELLPVIPTPSQPLSVGDKVYAHGGTSGMVNGVVLATGVTITVDRPASCGTKTEQFHDVVKVKLIVAIIQLKPKIFKI
jgi:hypothetical protein